MGANLFTGSNKSSPLSPTNREVYQGSRETITIWELSDSHGAYYSPGFKDFQNLKGNLLNLAAQQSKEKDEEIARLTEANEKLRARVS